MGMHSKCFVTVVGQYDTIILFNFKYHVEKHVVFVCVWITGQSFAQNTWRNRDYLEELDLAESIILKWVFKR